MYRLVIVSGPNRGSSFALSDGENSIGRQLDNHIVLTSSKVSKRHCVLVVNSDGVQLVDDGSTNGTFLNGSLARRNKVKPGDKVSVGDFVMELVRIGGSSSASVSHGMISGNNALAVAPEYSPGLLSDPMSGMPSPSIVPASSLPAEGQPSHLSLVQSEFDANQIEVAANDPVSKAKASFEGKVMPFFYGLILKNEYRSVIGAFFLFMVIATVAASIVPALDLAERSIRKEAFIRAKVLAREVADRNLPYVAARSESQIDLSLLEGEESVRMVAIVNPDLQIIAPQSRLNQILAGGREAVFALQMSKLFREGRERGEGMFLSDTVVAFIEPLKVVDPQSIKTVVAGMVIVSIDFSENLIHAGGMGVAGGTAIVISGLIALLFFTVMMRLTFKPFEVLNDELDQALRGVLPKVTKEFKIQELSNLFDNINSAVQRVGKPSAMDTSGNGGIDWDREFAAVRAMAEQSGQGYIALDPELRIIGINHMFEEISGMRSDVIGQSVQQAARDQAFPSMLTDLKDRVAGSPSRSVMDEFDFSGVSYQILAVGVGSASQAALAVIFKKKD